MTSNKKREQTAVEKLDNEYSLKFTKRELLVMNNAILAHDYKIGDALLLMPILNKIAPFVQPDRPVEQGNGIIK